MRTLLYSLCLAGCAALTLAASACSESDPGSPAASPSHEAGGAAGSSAAGSNTAPDAASNPGGFSGGEGGAGDGAEAGSGGATVEEPEPFDAPHNGADLLPFLMARGYATWHSEPDFHASSGPHGASVRVFYGPKAAAALGAMQPLFPMGAAAIKEVASVSGSIVGWSAWVKVKADSDHGNGFYWYEVALRTPNDTVYADALGSAVCVGCHSAGVDYRLSVTPVE